MRSASAYRHLASLLIPPRCTVCASPCRVADCLCVGCECALEAATPGSAVLDRVGPVTWATPYGEVARELVAALKFAGRLGLAERAAGAIVAALPPDLGRHSVVAVPAAPLRLRKRGFDPAWLIAAAVARCLDAPFEPVLRRRGGPRQVGKPRRDRIGSPPRVHAVGRPRHSALLVDDVLTTGATLGSCASALRAAGAVDLRAAVFARALGSGPISS